MFIQNDLGILAGILKCRIAQPDHAEVSYILSARRMVHLRGRARDFLSAHPFAYSLGQSCKQSYLGSVT